MEDAPRPSVEAGDSERRNDLPWVLLSKGQREGAERFPSVRKTADGKLYCDDSVRDNDTPVLPNGGRPTEILPGVRVLWSGEASRRPSLRPAAWGSSVKCRRTKRDLLLSLNVRSTRDRR